MWFTPFKEKGTIIRFLSKPSCRNSGAGPYDTTTGPRWGVYNTRRGLNKYTSYITYLLTWCNTCPIYLWMCSSMVQPQYFAAVESSVSLLTEYRHFARVYLCLCVKTASGLWPQRQSSAGASWKKCARSICSFPVSSLYISMRSPCSLLISSVVRVVKAFRHQSSYLSL